MWALGGALCAVLVSSCSVTDQLGSLSAPSSQGSVGSCHSFVIASMYEEKLEQEGVTGGLSEKDLFLRVYFRGLDERQEILRQLTMSVDRRLPRTFREGATLDRVAAVVKRHGVLTKGEDPYTQAFKAGLPMQMNQFRAARAEVYRKAAAEKARLGRPLTRAEKAAIVDGQYALLKKQGVVNALQIKQGNRAFMRKFAGNFVYRQVDAGRNTSKLPHIVKLLEQGSVGAGLAQYPWSRGSNPGAASGHAVVLRDYDPEKGEFIVTNPWWLGSFGFKRHDRVNARDFMRYLETYGWLQDTRPVAMRKTRPTAVAATRKARSQHAVSKSSGTGLFAKLFGKPSSRKPVQPDVKVAKVKTKKVVKTKATAKVDTPKKKGLLWKLFNKKPAQPSAQQPQPAPKVKKVKERKKPVQPAAQPKQKGLLWKLFNKKSAQKTTTTKQLPRSVNRVKKPQTTRPSRSQRQAPPARKAPASAKPEATDKPKGLLDKWFKKSSKKKS